MRLHNDVADIDADTESDASVIMIVDCKFADPVLELHGSPNCLDRTRKLGQESVASILYNATAMFGNGRLDAFREKRSQPGMSGLFVMVHEA
jgi:hypothetical protein